MKNILNINAVSDYMAMRKMDVLHPFLGIVDFDKVVLEGKTGVRPDAMHFKCYDIFLKDAQGCKLQYGGKSYDYDEGTLVFIGPGQTIELGDYASGYVPKGYAILFHPDLLLGTNLIKKIHNYSFFSYSTNEALHLSGKERKVLLSLIEKIQFELEQNLDKHSKKLMVSNLELFLDYCMRFYDRQFLTRETVHQGSLEKFDMLLSDYFISNKAQKEGLPSVGYFADKLNLSANYFGDLVKKETGKSALEYIQNKLIEVAKEKVFDPNKTISEIAFELGFKYPQHFTRTFKQHVGSTPLEFRSLN